LENKSKFVSLKRILPILTIILLAATQSNAQASRGPLAEQPSGKIVKLYPNPAKSYITFDFDKDQQKGRTITIYSFLGKKMYEAQTLTEKTTVTLNDYNRGMYIYHLTDAAGKIVESGKFQVTQ
jgi:hypothetical protein